MAINMTNGNISRHLIKFAVPLVLGNLFQLTYNAADSIIVGRFVGTNALAAVGTANPIMNIIVFFIVGICIGASVLMSEYFGAGAIEKFKREVSTTVIAGFIFTISTAILCILLTEPLLRLIGTPEEILAEAALYLRIIFCGLVFTFLYHVCSATLRSIGDSKTPLVFLVISSMLNVVMDLIFVIGFKMGVAGAAIATVAAEFLSCIFCIIYIYKRIPLLQFKKEEIVLDKVLLKITISYSWVTAMQQTCLHVGKVLVQAAVNPLGIHAIATFNAVNRVDDFAFTPQQNISHAMTTFIAQNRGAKKYHRIKQGFWTGMKIEMWYCVVIFTLVFFGSKQLMQLFVPQEKSEVVALGRVYLQMMAFFYILPGWTNGLQGYFRGMGELKVTLIATITQIAVRVFFAYLLAPHLGIAGIALSCFAGWVVMLIYQVPMFVKGRNQYNTIQKAA